jgi:predicted Rossmann-fold nucleotide-binding protein
MGALADGMLQRGGSITGVFTHALKGRETPHEGLTHLILSHTPWQSH